MICCYWWISVLERHLGIDPERKEKIFLLCDDELLLLMDLGPSKTFMDRWRTEGESSSTLRWWTVAANKCESFKQVDGQVEKQRINCFYFAMMICCCYRSPSRKMMDRWRTQGETVSTFRWWTVATDQCASFKEIYGQVANGRRNYFYFAMIICCCK